MIFYLIPLLFVDAFLIFTAFRGFIMSITEGNDLYRLLGMISVGLYGFLTCEVLLGIAKFYYPSKSIASLSATPLYSLTVATLTMAITYMHGRKWAAGYLLSLEKQ